MVYEDKIFMIKEYEKEIHDAIAICIDFNIPFEKVFKYDFILNYVYDLLDDNYKKHNLLYTNDYAFQKVRNELYIKYHTRFTIFRKTFQYIIINIVVYYKHLSYIFDSDIIKLIKTYYEDVTKWRKR